MIRRSWLAAWLVVCAAANAQSTVKPASAPDALTPEWMAVLDRISADSMKGHVSFLASDLLEGRNTPSMGLDIAAEYIAAQFRRAGLAPVGNGNYFQVAEVDVAGKKTPVRNVAALLPGSDPSLRDTYVVLSAHYDHLGTLPAGMGDDRIYNGANDNASGTASMLEIAHALGTAMKRPRRSILFLAFYGEEEGLLGSEFFVAHPLVAVDKIVALINLEQMGRTDDPAGPQIASLGVTGLRYSEIGGALEAAGVRTGVKIHGSGQEPDPYFERSDNFAFARAGVPAHTVGVAFEFPDYHNVADEWVKIDYDNMARVDRTVAASLILLAQSTTVPRWTEKARSSIKK